MSHIGISAARTAARRETIPLPNVPGLALLVSAQDTMNGLGFGSKQLDIGPFAMSGVSITGTTSQSINTSATNPSIIGWTSDFVGQYIGIQGANNAQNNGLFLITAASGNVVTYSNPTPGVVDGGASLSMFYVYPRVATLRCRVTGEIFDNATLATNPPLVPFNNFIGPLVITRATAITNLTNLSSAIAPLFNGNTLVSMGVYYSAAGTGTPDLFSFTNSISSYSNAIRYRQNQTTLAQQMLRSQTSVTTVSSVGTAMSTPTLVGLCYRPGIGTDHMISEGPMNPSPLDLDNGTVANGTERSPAGMAITALMGTVTGGTGTRVLGWVAGTQRWTITQWATIRQWFDNYFYPYP